MMQDIKNRHNSTKYTDFFVKVCV